MSASHTQSVQQNVPHGVPPSEGTMEAPSGPKRSRLKGKRGRILLAVLGVLLVAGVLGGVKGAQIGKLIAMGKAYEESGPPPEAVNSVMSDTMPWNDVHKAVGSVVSEQGVTLTNEVAGVVKRVLFESGQQVRKGQLLVELDAQVELAQRSAVLARKGFAEKSNVRSLELAESGAMTQSEADADVARVQELSADAQGLSAQIRRKRIVAPFAGKLGIRQINLGEYLAPGTPIAVLESTDELFVDFALPQDLLEQVALGTKVRFVRNADAASERRIEKNGEATEAGGTEAADASQRNGRQESQGQVQAIDPRIDPATRMFSVRASVETWDSATDPKAGSETAANAGAENKASKTAKRKAGAGSQQAEHGLRPGMFVHVEVMLAGDREAVVVPATAVVYAPYGDSVYLVEKKDGKEVAQQQFVQLGEMRGDFVAVKKGLKPNVQVVSAGAFKLQNGAAITIKNEVQPTSSLHPQVRNQ